MSKKERDTAREQIAELEEEHERRTTNATSAHSDAIEQHERNMSTANESFESATTQLNSMKLKHSDMIDKMKAGESDRQKKASEKHQEVTKELRNAHNRELENALVTNSSILKASFEYQNSEKNRREEKRQQLNMEGTKRVESELKETARLQELADAREKEHVELEQSIDKRHVEEITAMKDVLIGKMAVEHKRIEQHGETIRALELTGAAQKVQMVKAEQKMDSNKEANMLMDEVDGAVNVVVTKFTQLKAKVDMATRMKKASVLKMQMVSITKCLEDIRIAKENIVDLSSRLSTMNIDDKHEDRTKILRLLEEQLGALETLRTEFPILLQFISNNEMDGVVEQAQMIVDAAVDPVKEIRSLWNEVPPVDRTNLVHEQFLSNTDALLRGGSLGLGDEKMKELKNGSK